MNIFFTIKNSGSRRPHLNKTSITIDVGEVLTLENLISLIVKHQVNKFNDDIDNKNLFTFFQKHMKEESGKMSFGSIYNDNKADFVKAYETTIQAYEDGLIAVFVDEEQIEVLTENVRLKEGSELVFIRLTFLAGSIW